MGNQTVQWDLLRFQQDLRDRGIQPSARNAGGGQAPPLPHTYSGSRRNFYIYFYFYENTSLLSQIEGTYMNSVNIGVPSNRELLLIESKIKRTIRQVAKRGRFKKKGTKLHVYLDHIFVARHIKM